jgi:hypothetical protein
VEAQAIKKTQDNSNRRKNRTYIQGTLGVEHEKGMSAEVQQQQRKKGARTSQSKLILYKA